MLHPLPETAAERFALHLEEHYGLQLDAARQAVLVSEIQEFITNEVDTFLDPFPLVAPGPAFQLDTRRRRVGVEPRDATPAEIKADDRARERKEESAEEAREDRAQEKEDAKGR